MSTLESSVFRFLYSIPNCGDDFKLINNFVFFGSVLTIISGLSNFLSPAPYGRHSKDDSTPSWIPKIKSRTGWMISFVPVLAVPLLLFFTTPRVKLANTFNLFAYWCFTAHYANRFFYTTKISENAQPVSIVLLPFISSTVTLNTFLQSHHLANVHEIVPSPITYVGGFLALLGMYINTHHDNILINLRSSKTNGHPKSVVQHPKKSYRIPEGGLFKYISCANYFGEIVGWWGFALFCGGAPQVFAAVHSTTFLGIRALQHHKFYKDTFSSRYPSDRKAIIPFIL